MARAMTTSSPLLRTMPWLGGTVGGWWEQHLPWLERSRRRTMESSKGGGGGGGARAANGAAALGAADVPLPPVVAHFQCPERSLRRWRLLPASCCWAWRSFCYWLLEF